MARLMHGGVGSVVVCPWGGGRCPKWGACCDARSAWTPATSPAEARRAHPYPAAEAGVELVGETGVRMVQLNTLARRWGTAGLVLASEVQREAHLSSSVRRMMRVGQCVPMACLYVSTWLSRTQLVSATHRSFRSSPCVGTEVIELVNRRAALEPYSTGVGREGPSVSASAS